ncbi:MAG: putative toxin-antitoxin system toxin component, PIN family [Nitrospira sp.]|nr:putative toxin-antitoxin system toxin component, PIN family [Nitrospira sp.]
MGKAEKVVIDTNVFISAFGWGGNPLRIIELLERGVLRNCTSEDIARELFIAVSYPKLGFSQVLQTEILEFVLAYSDIHEINKLVEIVSDPEDNKFIECALASGAEFIITGDKSLLSMKRYKNIRIVTPEEFLRERKF